MQGIAIFHKTKGTGKHNRQRRQQVLQAADSSSLMKDKGTVIVVIRSIKCLYLETCGIILVQITGKKTGKRG